MNRDDLVVLKTFYSLDEASVAASVLRDRGIGCEVLQDDAGGAYPMLHLTSGVRLIVHPRDEAEARGILERIPDVSDEELARQAEAAGEESDEGEEGA